MRKVRIFQRNIGDIFPKHKLGRTLEAISRLLDEEKGVLDLVHRDLTDGAGVSGSAGRGGMTAEQVFRCGILKQMQAVTYEKLEIFLQDSESFRAFSRLDPGQSPSDTTLQENIALIRPETWRAINALLVLLAERKGMEGGRTVRIDTTVVETNIHPPTDATLLLDAIRTLAILLKSGRALEPMPGYDHHNHTRVAKKLALAVLNAKTEEDRVAAYKDLVAYALRLVQYAEGALLALQAWTGSDEVEEARGRGLFLEIERVLALLRKIIDQTRRRVFEKETVPASEKVVSLFEEHTDVIVKSRRGVEFGHKVCLATGVSSLVLDCQIERGNPADSSLYTPVVEALTSLFGRPPRQTSADGGFASKENLAAGKWAGIKDVCFAKKRGLSQEAMTKSPWVYHRLRNFRAGIEANISVLKRAFGLERCNWSGWSGFQAYVWSAIIAYNLATMARILLA